MAVRISERNVKKLKKELNCTDAEIQEAEKTCDATNVTMYMLRESDLPIYVYHFVFNKRKTIVSIPCNECSQDD